MSRPLVTVWAERDSPRLRFVLDWLLGERLNLEYRLVHDRSEAAATPHCIAYGWMEAAVSIHASSLLWEHNIINQVVERREWQGLYAPYFSEESPCDIQFDMLAGIFYLLTRHEEYGNFTPDRHGRYPAEQSILYQDGVLERPVVDEWVEALRLFLQEAWHIDVPVADFTYQPSYDIDIAWSYQYKGLKRTIGAAVLDLATGKPARLAQRLRVLLRKEADPYNAFIWLASQHMQYGLRPIWFFLAALRPSRHDRNISPRHPRMAALIKAFSEGAATGVHPSYYSDRHPKRLLEEKAVLESITGRKITVSRQHYIKLRFPQVYQALLAAGIEEDYSMGYSTHFGFRAGTGSPFWWYDLSAEKVTALRVHPFVFMDTTGRYDMGLSAEASFQKLHEMTEKLMAANSTLVTIFHNFSLGTDEGWAGWRKGYESFLRKIAELGAIPPG